MPIISVLRGAPDKIRQSFDSIRSKCGSNKSRSPDWRRSDLDWAPGVQQLDVTFWRYFFAFKTSPAYMRTKSVSRRFTVVDLLLSAIRRFDNIIQQRKCDNKISFNLIGDRKHVSSLFHSARRGHRNLPEHREHLQIAQVRGYPMRSYLLVKDF